MAVSLRRVKKRFWAFDLGRGSAIIHGSHWVRGAESMNKQELAAHVAESTGLGRVDAARAIDAMLDAITRALADGEKVNLVGFGNFIASTRKAATIINPRTREPMDIGATVTPKFRVGRNLKAACNGHSAD